jgi:undecaprenyl-diphosphatase
LQIVGESFPISSSGHIIFLKNIYSSFLNSPDTNIPEWFDYLLHIPTIIIVTYYFFSPLFNYCKRFVAHPSSLYNLLVSICVVDGITGMSYILKKSITNSIPFWLGFFITGCSLFSLRFVSYVSPLSLEKLSMKNAVCIGVAQAFSFLPGVSRFGITYVAGRWQGLSPHNSFFYSFLVVLPLFFAAGCKGLISLSRFYTAVPFSWSLVLVSIVFATLLSYYSFVWVGSLIRRGQLWYISYYMFALSGLTLILRWLI